MRRSCILVSLVVAAIATQPISALPGGTGQPAEPSAIEEDNDRHVREWLARLAGRTDQPAKDVFENLQLDWLRDVPARQFLDIMNGGYARALGVRCTHCHDARSFASDARRPKRAAREMARLHWDINRRLASMAHLRGSADDRLINCATCHRGRLDPRDP
jgi:hypothetical protein